MFAPGHAVASWIGRLRQASILLALVALSADAAAPKRVLLIHSASRDVAPVDAVLLAFRAELTRQLKQPLAFHEISLEARRAGSMDDRAFRDFLRNQYGAEKPDLVVTFALPALLFYLRDRESLFPEVPLLATSIDERRLAVVVGSSANERFWLAEAKAALAPLASRVKLVWLHDLTFEQLLGRVAALPSDSVILYMLFNVDANGEPLENERALAAVHAAASVPVFGMFDRQLGAGIVGGPLLELRTMGALAGEVARRMLEGEGGPEAAHLVLETQPPVFDWRELERWGIPESRLPPGSEVRFRSPSLWERYRWYFIGTLIIVAIQAAMIAGLLLQRTRRRRVEAELGESQYLMELAASAGEFGMWGRDLSGGQVWVNAPLRSLLGFGPKDALRLSDLMARIHPEDSARVTAAVQSAQERGLPFEGEFRAVLPDGTERWVLAKGRNVADPRLGRNPRRMGVVLDITERKRAEEKIRESETRFRVMANTAPVLIWMAGPDKLCTFFNTSWLDFTGRTLEQELGNGWTEGVYREDFDRCLDIYARAFDARQAFAMEYRLRRFDGEHRWVLDHGVPRSEPDGAFLGYIGTAIDITEVKRGEENFRLAVEASPSAFVMVDQQGRIVMVNVQAETMFGYAREELVGQSVEVLVPERYRVVHQTHRAGFLAAPQARPMGAGRELFGQRKNGSRVPVEIGLNPIHAPEGQFVLASIIDITERKRAEKESVQQRSELAHLSRASALGQLSASIAHQLNQPLAAILGNAEAAQKMLGGEPVDLAELREICADIVTEDHRAADVISRLRELFQRGDPEFHPLDVNALIRDTLSLLHAELLTRHATVVTDLAPSLPVVEGGRVQLQQVLINLVVNASDAMEGKAEEERELVVRTEVTGAGVRICVSDRGPGIAAEHLKKIFEPFWSSKPAGMGMGLAISQTIVGAHRGTLTAANNPKRGATFCFTLPVRQAT